MATLSDLKRVSEGIVRGDLNNAATLINHGLMDESIFVEEYWWIILRTWDIAKDSINQRRISRTGASDYMHNLETLKDKAEKYAEEHLKKDFEEYKSNIRSKSKSQM